MSAFLSDLFQSIFTPEPTNTLIVATNATFACLQLLLFILLVATYSLHFLILSGLSAGLWWAINWFVAEVRAGQAVEAEKKRQIGLVDTASNGESDTEAETVIDTADGSSGARDNRDSELVRARAGGGGGGGVGVGDQTSGSGRKSEASTEDEWERVSENEKDK